MQSVGCERCSWIQSRNKRSLLPAMESRAELGIKVEQHFEMYPRLSHASYDDSYISTRVSFSSHLFIETQTRIFGKILFQSIVLTKYSML